VTIDPRDIKSWRGFLDLLRPPSGYRLTAAFGTAFGLSFDALTAALLAMLDTDGESLARDPVAGVIAITRLRSRVRVLVHPATISNPDLAMPRRLIGLLDSFVGEVRPKVGLFHPKVWTLRFRKTDSDNEKSEIGRILICSRNLTGSRSFELGATLEGRLIAGDEQPSSVVADVASAMHAWLAECTTPSPTAVKELPAFVRRLVLEVPYEARDGSRFNWQGLGRAALDRRLPAKCGRVVVVSPFVRPDFVSRMLDRSSELRIVSTAECLDALDDLTFHAIEKRQNDQGTPVLYHVGEYGDAVDQDASIDGIHAKLVLVEGPAGSATFVGSANATAPGWGFVGPSNVEAMLELRPGIPVNAFVKAFIVEGKNKPPHPWIKEYDRTLRDDPDPDRVLERRLLSALRDVGMLELSIRYDEARQKLTLSLVQRDRRPPSGSSKEFTFDVTPLSLAAREDSWRPLSELTDADLVFDGIAIADVTAFIAVRARNIEPPVEKTRIVLARMHMTTAELYRRDESARQHLLAEADPQAVLQALIRGLAYLRSGGGSRGVHATRGGHSIQQLLAQTSLESVLQAVAVDRTIISDLKALVGPFGDDSFQLFCSEMEEACKAIDQEYDV